MEYRKIEYAVDPVKEREAIESFLDKYWDVKVEGPLSLSRLIGNILSEGIKIGIKYGEEGFESRIERYNKAVEIVNKIEGKKVADTIMITKPENPLFQDCREAYEWIRECAEKDYQISAKPKDYEEFKQKNKDEDCPNIEGDPIYEGTPLCTTLGASDLSFEEATNIANVLYKDRGNYADSLEIMIKSILTQGMNIGVMTVEKKFEPLSSL